MIKAVLDTNIWLSGIFWEGEASKIIEAAEKEKLEIIITENILFEIIDILAHESKFQNFLEDKKQNIEDLIRTILMTSKLVYTKSKIDIIKEHPADNIILEAALDSKADYIVSYDKHILNIIEFRGIKVVKPKEILNQIK